MISATFRVKTTVPPNVLTTCLDFGTAGYQNALCTYQEKVLTMYLAKDSKQESIKNSRTLITKNNNNPMRKKGTSQKISERSKTKEKMIDIISNQRHKYENNKVPLHSHQNG